MKRKYIDTAIQKLENTDFVFIDGHDCDVRIELNGLELNVVIDALYAEMSCDPIDEKVFDKFFDLRKTMLENILTPAEKVRIDYKVKRRKEEERRKKQKDIHLQ